MITLLTILPPFIYLMYGNKEWLASKLRKKDLKYVLCISLLIRGLRTGL